MSRRRTTKCRCCGDFFQPEARNRGRQKYCAKPDCRRAGKAASQRRWLAKPGNQQYFQDAANAARVRQWQRAHPGYWKNTARSRRRALQEASPPQVVDATTDLTTFTLQEACRLQAPVLIGLIAHLTDSTLQEDIASASQRLLQLGQDILSGRASDARQTGAAP